MPKFRSSILAAALATAFASGPAAAQFSNMFFFGDSATDAGSYKPVLPPGTGRFTTNPGEVWAQMLGTRYGFTITPANQGGTNYAQGGARITQSPGYPPQPPTASAVPVATQVSQAVAKGIDGNALYTIEATYNDIFTQIGLLQAGQITSAQLQANVALAATQHAQQIGVLKAAGANYILVLNIYDWSKAPSGVAAGPAAAAQFSAINGLFNSTLNAALNQVGGNVIRFNSAGLFNEIITNPAAYGITNTTATACGATPSLLCTPANLVTPNAASTYLFADGVHPTTAGHTILAQAVGSMIEGPMQMAALGEAPLAVEQANFRALDGRMWSNLNSAPNSKKFNAWVAYDYGSNDIDGTGLSGSADLNTITVGGDVRMSDKILMGMAAGYTENKSDFGNNGGDFKLKETTGSVYAGYGDGPWYAGVSMLVGDLDYSTTRNIVLGTGTRNESGNTGGYTYAFRLLGGYWFRGASELVHGPFAKVAYQDIIVRGFSENGSSSTTLGYGQQDRESLQTSLGWQVGGKWGQVRPWGRVTWEYEAKADQRTVQANSVTLGGQYTVPGYSPDDNWLQYTLGAAMDFGGVTGYISGSGTASKSDGDGYAVTVGLRVPL